MRFRQEKWKLVLARLDSGWEKFPPHLFFPPFLLGPMPASYMAWFYGGNGLKLYQEMYDIPRV